MPRADVVGPESEACGMDVAAAENDTWECCGVVVHAIMDTWDADVLSLSV